MTDVGIAPENLEATEAWNGPLFDTWQDFQAVVVSNARAHGDAALADHAPERGDRVLDIGCGLGDSTVQLAELVGPQGHAHGVNASSRAWRLRGGHYPRRPNVHGGTVRFPLTRT